MNAAERRKKLLKELIRADAPVSAAALADTFSVSRQVIVGDVAILRAAGHSIYSTPRGYVVPNDPGGVYKTIACVHGYDEIRDELFIFVDNGCTVIDVTVEHPVYGQITGNLHLGTRYDVEQFAARLAEYDASPLSTLTGGIHLHRVRCPDESAFHRVEKALSEKGFLVE
ncbi:MAG: transcription repressor NadR [Oscillospiraceae bacterium]|nr:transcription repressor NadR [Oscillospiraceae bacterium]